MTRKIKQEDLFDPKNTITTLEPDTDFGRDPVRTVYVYTIFGQHDYLDENNYPSLLPSKEQEDWALAKKVKFDDKEKYFVKKSFNGRLFDPLEQDEWTHNKFDNHIGAKRWNFAEVSLKVFRLYIDFLKTKNKAYHLNAEREI